LGGRGGNRREGERPETQTRPHAVPEQDKGSDAGDLPDVICRSSTCTALSSG